MKIEFIKKEFKFPIDLDGKPLPPKIGMCIRTKYRGIELRNAILFDPEEYSDSKAKKLLKKWLKEKKKRLYLESKKPRR